MAPLGLWRVKRGRWICVLVVHKVKIRVIGAITSVSWTRDGHITGHWPLATGLWSAVGRLIGAADGWIAFSWPTY